MKKFIRILGAIILWLIAVGIFQAYKPLPSGVDYTGHTRGISANDASFLYDLAYEKDGERIHEQHVFDRIFAHIRDAERYILIDMFLFNSYLGNAGSSYRNLSHELTAHLMDAKKRSPEIRIDVITDPINIVYGGDHSPEMEMLKACGINVITTDLKPLRDSNPVYSAFWRTFIHWFGNSPGGLFPHPFSATGPDVSLRTYLNLINFKANHRKIFMADSADSYVSVITSANPHDASSAHSNVALEIRGNIASDLYETEKGLASFSGAQLSVVNFDEIPVSDEVLRVQALTEEAIHWAAMDEINSASSGDSISMAMFYLSERNIINALKSAAARGVKIRLVLDPNKDAFGYEKTGIPNRPVAGELVNETRGMIQVRWYKTMGEQFHSKMILIERSGESTIILGSANLTRRNLRNYNLELDVMLKGKNNARIFSDIRQYFDRIWTNPDGIYTTGYDAYKDDSVMKKVIYNIQERTGLSSF
ncbi:MAG: phospholipase [Deltaproteobacteria bacterium]|nr:phospholipase [Deltaproteobacteria bacterium]